MKALKVKGLVRVSDERRYDPNTQEEYRATTWTGHGHEVEINQDRYGYHCRGDHDPKTAAANLDEGGVLMWLTRFLFGGGR